MRPAVMPENLLERIALFSGLVPTPLFNIIRTVPPEQAAKIINRAFQSLDQAGTVVILDSEHSGEENNLSATAGFNELFFFLINGTKVYPQDLIRSMYELLGIDPDGPMPNSRGLSVQVLPAAEDGAQGGGRLKEIM